MQVESSGAKHITSNELFQDPASPLIVHESAEMPSRSETLVPGSHKIDKNVPICVCRRIVFSTKLDA